MADIISLSAARAAGLPAPPAQTYTGVQIAHAHRIGDRIGDAINSGWLGRSPLRGTIEEETDLVRRLEMIVARLRQRAAGLDHDGR